MKDNSFENISTYGAVAEKDEIGEALHIELCDVNFNALFETSPNSYLVLASNDPVLTIIAVNDAYLRATKTRREDILGRAVFEVFPENPDDPSAESVRNLHDSFRRALDSRAPHRMDILKYDIPRPASEGGGFEERYWRPLNTPVLGPDGEVTALIHYAEDVTERVRTEESISLATGAAEVGTWDLNLKTDVMTWSVRTRAMFGISPDVPCSMDEFYGGLHPEDRNAASEAFAAAIDPARRASYDVEYRTIGREDGVVRWVAAKGKGIFDTSGSCLRVIGTATNITKRKEIEERLQKSEAELRDLNTSLEMRVAERTAELEEAQEVLRQSQKMEAVGQLTGGLAHDFNNLLAVITGSLELLERRLAKGRLGDLDRFITASQTAAKRATSLTHRLLAFSRRQTLDPQQTDVNALVAGILDMVQRTVGPEITVETTGKPDLWTTLVDPGQLENALLNLCINARDAMPGGRADHDRDGQRHPGEPRSAGPRHG